MLSFLPESGKVKNQGPEELLLAGILVDSEIECLPELWVGQFRLPGLLTKTGDEAAKCYASNENLLSVQFPPASQQFIVGAGEWA